MSIVKSINVKSSSFDDLIKIHNYLADDLKTDYGQYIDGLGFFSDDYISELNAVKIANQKTTGSQFEQITVSASPVGNSLTDEDYMDMGYDIARYYFEQGHQILWYLHKDTKVRHLHFLMNSVNFKSGKKFSQSKSALNRFKVHCDHAFSKYNLDRIRGSLDDIVSDTTYNIMDGFDCLEIFDDILTDNTLTFSEMSEEGVLIDTSYQPFVSNSYRKSNLKKNYPRRMYMNASNISGNNNLPNPIYSESTTFGNNRNRNNGLSFVNVNNVEIQNMNELGQAVATLNHGYCNNAVAAADAMSVLRANKVYCGVTMTNINNYYLAGNNPMSSNNIIDGQFSEVNNTSAFSSPTYYPAPPYGNNFNPYGNGGCPPMQIDW